MGIVAVCSLLNIVYDMAVESLTALECHRTHSQHEASIIFKKFWFRLINFYSPMFFLMYKDRLRGDPGSYQWPGCVEGGCTYEMAMMLMINMAVKPLFGAILENYPIVPTLKKLCAPKYNQAEPTDKRTNTPRWEEDFLLEAIQEQTLFYEYLEMVIQFGFIVLFVAAFPLAPLFALINNVIELRTDAYKFVRERRKPVAETAMGIGAWEQLLRVLCQLGVVTNGVILAFTSHAVEKLIYVHEHGNYDGFVKHSLSTVNTTCIDKGNYVLNFTSVGDEEQCNFWGHKVHESGECTLKPTLDFWRIFAYKTLSVVILYILWMFQSIIDYVVPDKSKRLENDTKREKHLARLIVKQAEKVSDLPEKQRLEIAKTATGRRAFLGPRTAPQKVLFEGIPRPNTAT